MGEGIRLNYDGTQQGIGAFSVNPQNSVQTGFSSMQNYGAPTATVPGGGSKFGFMDRMLGAEAADGSKIGGWGMPALQLGTGLMQGYLGMKQYGLAKDQFKESQDQYADNYDSQRRLTNAQLRDRQKARVNSNPNAQSVEAYMKENEVQERS